MTGHSILFLGRGDFASEYLAELETLPCCTMLARSPELKVPVENRELLDIVLLEASPVIARWAITRSLQSPIRSTNTAALPRCVPARRAISASTMSPSRDRKPFSIML
jgi:hypothetical protein